MPERPFVFASVEVAKILFPGVKHPAEAFALLSQSSMCWITNEGNDSHLLAIPSLVQSTPPQVNAWLATAAGHEVRMKLVAQDAGLPPGTVKKAALKLIEKWRDIAVPRAVEEFISAVDVWWNGVSVYFAAHDMHVTLTTACSASEYCGGTPATSDRAPETSDHALAMEAKRYVEELAAEVTTAAFGVAETMSWRP